MKMFRALVLLLGVLALGPIAASDAATPLFSLKPIGRTLAPGNGGIISMPVHYGVANGNADLRMSLTGRRQAVVNLRRRVSAPPKGGLHSHRLKISEASLRKLLGPGRVGTVVVRATMRRHFRTRAAGPVLTKVLKRTTTMHFAATPPAGSKIHSFYNAAGKNGDSEPSADVTWSGGKPYLAAIYVPNLSGQCGSATEQPRSFGPTEGEIIPDLIKGGPARRFEVTNALVDWSGAIYPTTTSGYSGTLGTTPGADPYATLTLSWKKAQIFFLGRTRQCTVGPGTNVTLKAVPGF